MERVATRTGNAWQTLIQGHNALEWKDRVAAGVISIALIALTIGVFMATGRSGAKALSSLAASPLLYLGVTSAYPKLTQKRSVEEAIELEDVVKNEGLRAGIDSVKAADSEESIFLALFGHTIINPKTEVDHKLNQLATQVTSAPEEEQARLRAEHQPKELSPTALHIQRTQAAGAKIGKSPEQVSQDILAAASAVPAMRPYNMGDPQDFYQQHLWVVSMLALQNKLDHSLIR